MAVIRRIFIGILWFCTTYFAIIVVGGAISGGISSHRLESEGLEFLGDEALDRLAGGYAGEYFVETYCESVLLFSLIFSALGASIGFLPGARSAKEEKMSKNLESQTYSAKQLKTITIAAWVILIVGAADAVIGIISKKFPLFGVLCLALSLYLILFLIRKHSLKDAE